MKVAIFETTHFEGAYPVIKLFDNGSNEITVFTYEHSYRQFQFLFGDDLKAFKWIVKKENESKYRFLRRMFAHVHSSETELFYLNTITDNYIFYAWMISRLKGVRVVTTLHSINNYFQHRPSFSLRRVVRIIGKKELIRVVKEFNVVALTMVDYLRQKIPATKKVHCLPGAIYEPEKHLQFASHMATLDVVIPGVIDERRRDYQMVIDLLEQTQQANMNVCVTMLGGFDKTYGQNVLRTVLVKDWKGKLKYYQSEVVDQPEFDRVMEQCSLVLLPSKIYTKILDDITEEYGFSMSSGNLFDIIKHAKPFVAPVGLRVDPFLEESCIRYKEPRDILNTFKRLIDSPDLLSSLTQRARTASSHYTIDAVRKRNSDLFS